MVPLRWGGEVGQIRNLHSGRPAAVQQVHQVVEQPETDRWQLACGRAATQHCSPVGALGERLSAGHDCASLCLCRHVTRVYNWALVRESSCCSSRGNAHEQSRINDHALLLVRLGAAQDSLPQRVAEDAHDDVAALALHAQIDDASNGTQLCPAQLHPGLSGCRSAMTQQTAKAAVSTEQECATRADGLDPVSSCWPPVSLEYVPQELLVEAAQCCDAAHQDAAHNLCPASLDEDCWLLEKSHGRQQVLHLCSTVASLPSCSRVGRLHVRDAVKHSKYRQASNQSTFCNGMRLRPGTIQEQMSCG